MLDSVTFTNTQEKVSAKLFRIAIANLIETRSDFREKRQAIAGEERDSMGWLEKENDVLHSDLIFSMEGIRKFTNEVNLFKADALIVHIPIWTDPSLTVKLVELLGLPVLLMGNDRKDSSSFVGLLGAGGSLDQVGIHHTRVMNHEDEKARGRVQAFIRAASAIRKLSGQTYGLIGGRSLGMLTAAADPSQWHKLFKVDIEHLDQLMIVEEAGRIPADEVEAVKKWLIRSVRSVEFDELFTREAFNRQIRSYLATRNLAVERDLDFLGVKCQPELSDGYTTQCLSHMLMNSSFDNLGTKNPVVHSCEADSDGALTMQILHHLSGASPTALLDLRLFNFKSKQWTLANCGAAAADFASSESGEKALGEIRICPHVFGKAGGCALPFTMKARKVTMARLCRRDGKYWMALVEGEIEEMDEKAMAETTSIFPQAKVRTNVDERFLQIYGSNHIHMVSGNWIEEVKIYCDLMKIPVEIWVMED